MIQWKGCSGKDKIISGHELSKTQSRQSSGDKWLVDVTFKTLAWSDN